MKAAILILISLLMLNSGIYLSSILHSKPNETLSTSQDMGLVYYLTLKRIGELAKQGEYKEGLTMVQTLQDYHTLRVRMLSSASEKWQGELGDWLHDSREHVPETTLRLREIFESDQY